MRKRVSRFRIPSGEPTVGIGTLATYLRSCAYRLRPLRRSVDMRARGFSRIFWLLIIFARPLSALAEPQPADKPVESGFSPLDEITPANVGQLAIAFTFRTGVPGAHTSAPLLAGDMLMVLTAFPHKLYALDLTKPGVPVKWIYAPKANGVAEGLTCCGAPTGGLSAGDGRVYLSTLDGHVVALDRANGKVIWDVVVAHPEAGEVLGYAPLPVHNEVIAGASGADAGARGFLLALDASTGQERWKVFSTGPDRDVGIGEFFRPFYRGDAGAELGIATWPPSAWQHGGGGLAGPLVFDAGSGLLFQATGHPAPWNPDQREGENRWTSGLFARDPETGAARWFDAMNPHDLYGLGAGGGLLLAAGPGGPVLIHPDANGYLYLLDPVSGEIRSAQSYLPVTATRGIDRATGGLIRDPHYTPQPGSTVRDICPAWPAGSNALPAFSPRTGLVYLPVAQLCMDMEAVSTSYISGTLFTGANVRMKPAGRRSPGALIGWDLAAGRAAWTVPEPLPLRGGALATEGGLVFYGTLDSRFKAVDARTGRVLWEFRTTSGIVGRPVVYRGPDGHQYVAVLAGSGGLTGTKSAREIDARDATAAHGLAAALGPLPPPEDASGTLIAFRLP